MISKNINKLNIRFKLWRKHSWFSVRYPVSLTDGVVWITNFRQYMDEVNELRNELKSL